MAGVKLLLCLPLVSCYICNDIYFGTVDFHLCPERCAKCSLLYSCLECENELSNSTCRSICKVGCDMLFISNGTNLRGCYRGKEGNNCCIYCPPFRVCAECVQISGGQCEKCTNNLYGNLTHCDKKCGNCRPNEDEIVTCNIVTGHCQGDCLDGFYGNRCDKKCSQYCFNSHSNSRKCERHSGNCIFGCGAGRYNEKCQSICSKTCLNNNCNQSSGTCNDCMPGWYGDTCESKCSETCANKACDQKTGLCLKGCIPGRYGNNCKRVCSTTCIGNTCHQISGHCKNGCLNGWFGNSCNNICNSTCLNRTCEQTTQHCVNGCVPGKYGIFCNKTCSNTCEKKTCDQSSGKCLFGCVAGWFGQLCNTSCSRTCFNISCEQMAGVCDRGCIEGYYGENCEGNCSETRLEASCENYTTACLSCDSRFGNGVTKSYEISTTIIFSMDNIMVICLLSVFSILLCFLCILIVRHRVVVYRNENIGREIVLSEMKKNTREESIYDEIKDLNDTDSQPTCATKFGGPSSHLLGGIQEETQAKDRSEESLVMLPFDVTVYSDAYAEYNTTKQELARENSYLSLKTYETRVSTSRLNSDTSYGSKDGEDNKLAGNSDDDVENVGQYSLKQSKYSSSKDSENEHHMESTLDASTDQSEELVTNKHHDDVLYLHAVN